MTPPMSPERATLMVRTTGGFVYRRGDGRAIDLGGFQMTVKATGEETGGAFTLLEADEPPGFGPSLHVHPTS
jgi:hypothetical protein